MILIIGGLGAGKRDFAVQALGARYEDMAQAELDVRPILYDLQDMVPLPAAEQLERKKIVICNEVGSGVVPIDRVQREHREAVGRLCIQLAQRASEVYRVHCGLGMRLK